MNRSYLFAISLATTIVISCNSKLTPQHGEVLNKQSTDTHGNPMLLGKCTREKLTDTPYASWFKKNYDDYSVDTATAEILREKLKNKNLMIFMGTWCGDSRREVPRMFKILDYCGIKPVDIQLIMVDSHDSVYKQSPTHEERGLNIHRVPDLLVFQKGNEIGRIVESPVNSLEKDLVAIVEGHNYVPNYQIVPLLVKLFDKENTKQINEHLDHIYTEAKPLMKHPAELTSYGHVLMAASEKEKAEIAFKLNTMLYPDNPNMFEALGNYYHSTGNETLANENLEKARLLKSQQAPKKSQ